MFYQLIKHSSLVFFSYANFQRSQKHDNVMNSIDTHFFRNVFEAIQKTRSTYFIGSKTTLLCLVVLNPIKHSCSFFKHYVNSLHFPECLVPNGKFADPADGSGYFECIKGTAVKKSCPTGQQWNQQKKRCELNLCKYIKYHKEQSTPEVLIGA